MSTPSSNPDTESSNAGRSGGTPEETSFTVKQVAGTWVVENNLGEQVGESSDREEAIETARRVAKEQNASGISVFREDGSRESTIDV